MKALTFLLCLLPASAFAWNADEIDFPGEGNGWSIGSNSVKFTGPDGYSEWFRYTLVAPSSDPDYEFLMVTGNNWGQKYGGNVIFERDALDVLYYGSGQPNARFGGVTAGKRYVFTVKNPGLADTWLSVQELDAAPVSITAVSRDAGSGVITADLSGTPSPKEKVYVRYTDDGWSHWSVARANVGGATATASIPEVKDGRTYQYYVFTSTAAPDKFHNGFAVDCCTLAWNNNSGSNYSFAAPQRITAFSVNGEEGSYKTTKFFIDEIAGDSQPVSISATFASGETPAEVQLVTNLNRRDRADADANGDGIEDAILPPSRDTVDTGDANYYRAYPMSGTGGVYQTTLTASKTGAYRATVRYRMSGSSVWHYYQGRPAPAYGGWDHALVVSPRKTLEMTLYEVNPLTVEATAANQAGRSTFVDLLGAADGDSDGSDPVNLDYFNYLQVNCLWFQPIHPTGQEGVENDPDTNMPYQPGSPYATRNFFAVNPAMGSANTEASALAEFQNLVAKAGAYQGSVGTVNVMLDFVANHTAWDAVYGQGGVNLGYTADAAERLPISWYSRKGNYGLPARWHNSPVDSDIAVAPDRHDFGKWNDVAELNYGRYSALVELQDGSQQNRYKNEDDLFDYGCMNDRVVKLWRYLGRYPQYWLQQTGHTLSNSSGGTAVERLAADNKGIDSLRCDFGQGLPNPLWEYIINRTRSMKWNFVFMAETLDGAEPGYRSNRVFDILNESIVFQFTQAHINSAVDLRSALDARRNTYRSGAILLNLTGHDEVLPDNDPWLNATRYGALSTVHGLPMIFNGQEQGIQNYNAADPTYDGFDHHELNFGKYIPHFKKWNRLRVWDSPPPFSAGMAQWYGRVNWARHNSPALAGLNQYYLDKRPDGSAPNTKLFAIARYQTAGASPAHGDVVLAFANLFAHGGSHALAADTFGLRGTGDELWGLLGLSNSVSRLYNVRNLASSDASALLWPSPRSGADLYQNGIHVSLGGGTSSAITADGELVQYLKLVDVTPPPAPQPLAPYYVIGTSGTFTWVPSFAPQDGISHYRISVGTSPGGTEVANQAVVPFGTKSYAFAGTAGTTYYATLVAVSNAGIVSTTAGSSDAGAPNPASPTTPVRLLDPSADEDGDGQPNAAEQMAGTNPLAADSVLKIVHLTRSGADMTVQAATVPGKIYQLETSVTLLPDSWVPAADQTTAVSATTDFVHPGGSGAVRRFYRIRVVP
ncbi:MAG: hypothetical protein J0M04_00445 [Verrucomicrobia bacterium]|nr:hypothetical protein [Verrucomicrobiota bacterium]